MAWNFKKELARKFIHLLSIMFLWIYLVAADLFDRNIALLVLVLLLISLLELEYFRIEIGKKIPILSDIWSSLRRKKERKTLGGDVFFLIGAILVLSIFNLRVAIISILMTTFGDMAAALIGTKFGKHQLFSLKLRTWEGTSAEFIVDIAIGAIVLFWGGIYMDYFWKNIILILVMATTATFIETIVYKLDDNLLIPVFSGFFGQITLMILSAF
jgi:dolichol kinase